jgi:hypothetical protein
MTMSSGRSPSGIHVRRIDRPGRCDQGQLERRRRIRLLTTLERVGRDSNPRADR